MAVLIANVGYWSSKIQIDGEVDKRTIRVAKRLNQSSRKLGARTEPWKL